MKKGIVVLGHGSRANMSEANQVVFQIADMVKEKVDHDLVEAAIINRMSKMQTLTEAVERLISRGAESVTVAPMFFANGTHIQGDIPEEIGIIQDRYPGVPIHLAQHIGADTRIADILVERAREAW